MLTNALRPLKATLLDDDAFRLLAIPFGGPIPSGKSSRGVDLDGEWFSARTDIKPDWFDVRLVDWHHGKDRVMGRTVLGKAGELKMEDDGWWVTVWLNHGERRLELVKKLSERGATLYGSSETIGSMAAKADTGEILTWPYVRQTLSTSPQNTYSIMRPLKAALDDMLADGVTPGAAFWSDLEAAMRSLGADLRESSHDAGALGAKAGRVLSAANESDLMASMEAVQAALDRLAAVVGRQTKRQE